ncbi:T9SS type A sorting domain-containing protein [Melioribacter sp. Ez-97]|uniref:T9SS type A sorting domain-containing protein n=1 Tax=Melioribacter sp. Ez-97 TaxID=3423434 RepID=UPI003ED9A614
MKKVVFKNVFIVIMFLISGKIINAQDWPLAPEVWSEPILLDSALNIPFHWFDSPAFTKSMDTLYFTGGNGVFRAVKNFVNGKTIWDVSRLNDKVNPPGQLPPISCPISRDGKRMYISNYGDSGYGGQDIWRSDWNDSTKDWGPPVNMGPGINTPRGEVFFYELSRDSAYVLANHTGLVTMYLYTFDNQKNDWAVADSFANVTSNPFENPFTTAHIYGLSTTQNKKKLYFARQYYPSEIGQPIKEAELRKQELVVSYWDNKKNTWGNCYYLNINSRGYYPDSIKWPTFVAGGEDRYPWISEDGKVLVFSSARNVKIDSTGSGDELPKLYISYLLKDENGSPVSVEIDKHNKPSSFYLFQNYPNPFNGSTIIAFNLMATQNVKLIIYDILGKELAVLIDKEMTSGMHTITFNPLLNNLSSGVYIYCLITKRKEISKQMIYLK